MMRRNASTPHESSEESYFASFTDMLVGILFIFIILLMIAARDYQEATDAVTEKQIAEQIAAIAEDQQKALDQARNKELWKTQQDLFYQDRAKILLTLESALKQRGMPVAVDVHQGVLRLPENIMFASGENAVHDTGKQAVAILAEVLGTYLPCITPTADPSRLFTCNFLNLASNDGLDAVYVVDNPEFNGSSEQKWLLSVQRTISVFSELTQRDPYLDTGLKNTTGVPVLNVAAKKERRLLDQHDRAKKNKVIELWFKMRSPTPDDIKRLKAVEDAKKQSPAGQP